MIIFHEGLPGAGKSYETCVEHIIPALLKGRKVFAYIEGLNHEKFAEVTLLPVAIVQNYLIQIERDQVKEIYKYVENDSLVVLDEVQNFWPSTREKPTEQISRFVTEHRHLGLDIVLMGQDIRDCHTIWRRRVEQKTVYTKLTAIGRDKSYKWVVFRAVSGEKFQKISSGTKNYQKKYFGLYASYETGTNNTKTYKDKRAVIWNNPMMKYGVPIFLIIIYFALNHLAGFFGLNKKETKTTTPTITSRPAFTVPQIGQDPQIHRNNQSQLPPPPPPPPPPLDEFDDMVQKYRPRLLGVVQQTNQAPKIYIQILDSSFHVKDLYTSVELILMGWKLSLLGPTMVQVTKDDKTHLIRNWPIDPFGKVSESVTNSSAITGS